MHLLVGSVTLYMVLFSKIKKKIKKNPRKNRNTVKDMLRQIKTGSVVVMIRVKLAV